MSQKTKIIIFASVFVLILAGLITSVILLTSGKKASNGNSNISSIVGSSSLQESETESFDASSNLGGANQGTSEQIDGNSNSDGSVSDISQPQDSRLESSRGSNSSIVQPSPSISSSVGTGDSKIESSRSSSSSSQSQEQSKVFSILADPTFENGFRVLGMNVNDGGSSGATVLDPLDSGGRQYWNLAQWGSRYSFADRAHTSLKKLANGVYNLKNTTKEFGIDYNKNMLTFTGITSTTYDSPRTGGDWHHLLIEQSFKTADTKISGLSKVQVSMANRLTYFKDNMGSAFNPGLHAAQFLMYFMVANNDTNSKDYSNFIWFGFPFFDNRLEWNPPSSMLDRGTNRLMVGIGNEVLYKDNNKNNCWKNGAINAGPDVEWSYFSIDVLPMIIDALDIAHRDGYLKNTTVDQLAITGMNLGWEIPGSYDVTMEVKDFSILGTRK